MDRDRNSPHPKGAVWRMRLETVEFQRLGRGLHPDKGLSEKLCLTG